MKKDNKTVEEKIVYFLNKEVLSEDKSLDLLDELYWADWDLLKEKYPESIDKVFDYFKKDNFSNREISQILKLYNNPHGAYIEKFSHVILNLYNKDKVKFIRSLNLEKEEAVNLVYLFRNHLIKLDKDLELLKIIESDDLTEEEKDTGESLLKAYKHACST